MKTMVLIRLLLIVCACVFFLPSVTIADGEEKIMLALAEDQIPVLDPSDVAVRNLSQLIQFYSTLDKMTACISSAVSVKTAPTLTKVGFSGLTEVTHEPFDWHREGRLFDRQKVRNFYEKETHNYSCVGIVNITGALILSPKAFRIYKDDALGIIHKLMNAEGRRGWLTEKLSTEPEPEFDLYVFLREKNM